MKSINDRFVMDTDNGCGYEFLFRINDDGSRSIATIENIHNSETKARIEELNKICNKAEMDSGINRISFKEIKRLIILSITELQQEIIK